MKKFFICIVLFLCVIPLRAQTSVGRYIKFPDAKMWGAFYKPQLAFGIIDDCNYLVLLCTNPNDYATFDEASRLLIRFEDGTVEKLPLDWEHGVERAYDNMVVRSDISEFFQTYTCYKLEDEVIAKIEAGVKIIKIRVAFSNGNVRDFDIAEKYQSKLIAGLQTSRIEALESHAQRLVNATDEDF